VTFVSRATVHRCYYLETPTQAKVSRFYCWHTRKSAASYGGLTVGNTIDSPLKHRGDWQSFVLLGVCGTAL